MIKDLFDRIRSFIKMLGLTTGLIGVGTVGATLYTLKSDSDTNARDIIALREEQSRMLRDIHQKELTCKELQHQIVYNQIKYSYCRE